MNRKILLLTLLVNLIAFNSYSQTRIYKNTKLEYLDKNGQVAETQYVDVKIVWETLSNSIFDLKSIQFKNTSITLISPSLEENGQLTQVYFAGGVTNSGLFPYLVILKDKVNNRALFDISQLGNLNLKIAVDFKNFNGTK
jgi:hypothetical protein